MLKWLNNNKILKGDKMSFSDLIIGDMVIKIDGDSYSFVTIVAITLKYIMFSDNVKMFFDKCPSNLYLNTTSLVNENKSNIYTVDVELMSTNACVFNYVKKYFAIYDETVINSEDIITVEHFR